MLTALLLLRAPSTLPLPSSALLSALLSAVLFALLSFPLRPFSLLRPSSLLHSFSPLLASPLRPFSPLQPSFLLDYQRFNVSLRRRHRIC